jgi:hypothetical protein
MTIATFMNTPRKTFRPLQAEGAFCHDPKAKTPPGEAGLSGGVKLGDFNDMTRQLQNGSKGNCVSLRHLAQEVGNPAEALLAFLPLIGSKPVTS